jgi:hypothetical protein
MQSKILGMKRSGIRDDGMLRREISRNGNPDGDSSLASKPPGYRDGYHHRGEASGALADSPLQVFWNGGFVHMDTVAEREADSGLANNSRFRSSIEVDWPRRDGCPYRKLNPNVPVM